MIAGVSSISFLTETPFITVFFYMGAGGKGAAGEHFFSTLASDQSCYKIFQ